MATTKTTKPSAKRAAVKAKAAPVKTPKQAKAKSPKVKATAAKTPKAAKPAKVTKPKAVKPASKRKALKPVRIAFVLDRSGSMNSMWVEAINGTNAFIADQQKLGGDGTFTLVTFDHEYQKVYNNIALERVAPVDPTVIVPRGTTALYEAVGRTLEDMLEKPPAAKNTLNIIAIMTDGQNNVWSHYYTPERVKELVTTAEKKKYQVVFLAANLDVAAVSKDMGMSNKTATASYAATPVGATNALRTLSQSVAKYRTGVTKSVDLAATTVKVAAAVTGDADTTK